MSSKPYETCGSLYLALWQKANALGLFSRAPENAFALYAFGFAAGQAEKVYSGACAAFMIRPVPDWWMWAGETMGLVCKHYHLVLYRDPKYGELWGCADENTRHKIDALVRYTPRNSPHWHTMRAMWCGVIDVDTQYHERIGHGARCEPEKES